MTHTRIVFLGFHRENLVYKKMQHREFSCLVPSNWTLHLVTNLNIFLLEASIKYREIINLLKSLNFLKNFVDVKFEGRQKITISRSN